VKLYCIANAAAAGPATQRLAAIVAETLREAAGRSAGQGLR
jgi:hypothetical protein